MTRAGLTPWLRCSTTFGRAEAGAKLVGAEFDAGLGRTLDRARPPAVKAAEAVLGGLKGFQRQTAEYAFHRLFKCADSSRRFLIADEVGLGKTLVAAGVIARWRSIT